MEGQCGLAGAQPSENFDLHGHVGAVKRRDYICMGIKLIYLLSHRPCTFLNASALQLFLNRNLNAKPFRRWCPNVYFTLGTRRLFDTNIDISETIAFAAKKSIRIYALRGNTIWSEDAFGSKKNLA